MTSASPDLRDWLRQLGEMGQIREVHGADCELEIGAVAEMLALQASSRRCILFDDIKDYPKGWRVVCNSVPSRDAGAKLLNLSPGKTHLELVKEWRERSSHLELTLARSVSGGPVLDNVLHGQDIDLRRFPAPLWHEDDGGRYIGTGDLVVTRDPDSGEINVGTYRIQVQDRDKLGLYIAPGQHGRLHRDRYFERGKPMPVVAAFGMHPLLFLASSMKLPLGMNEFEWVGAVQGSPVEVIEGPITGLPFPANAEIVIEGFVHPEPTAQEGPFGEFTGYYASASRQETYVQVEALYHRDEPIILGAQVMRPPGESYHAYRMLVDALAWSGLEESGVPDVRGVATIPAAANGFAVISLKQRYAGHAKQAGMLAALKLFGSHGLTRYIIVVDEDIDPSNVNEVLWALWTRADPAESAEVIPGCPSQALDTVLSPAKRLGRDYTASRMVIDATRPFHWREQFPKVVGSSEQLRARIREKWGEQLL